MKSSSVDLFEVLVICIGLILCVEGIH